MIAVMTAKDDSQQLQAERQGNVGQADSSRVSVSILREADTLASNPPPVPAVTATPGTAQLPNDPQTGSWSRERKFPKKYSGRPKARHARRVSQ